MRATDSSRVLFERAALVIPGGVNSPVRAFRAVGGHPYFVASAKAEHVLDEDGNAYLDYVQSWGASILGHAHPRVLDAIAAAAGRGTSYGAPTRAEVELAERIVAAAPGAQMARLLSSGTEAAMTAVRLCRAATGRDKVVCFSGCYHGHSDTLLASGGSGIATLGLPASAGVPRAAVADTLVAPFNVLPELDTDVACVIVEPVAANMGLVRPAAGFLDGLRAACDKVGALLVFDEVITGFRLGPSGAAGRHKVTPDLYVYGKVIGGGLPLAALAGRRELMELLAPVGPVYQAGTLSGNPLACAAGLAVLDELDEGAYDELSERVSRLADGLEQAILDAGIAVTVPREHSLCSVFFSSEAVGDYEAAKRAGSNGLYARFFNELLERKVALAPSPFEVMFTSLAHSDADIEVTIEAAASAARSIAAG